MILAIHNRTAGAIPRRRMVTQDSPVSVARDDMAERKDFLSCSVILLKKLEGSPHGISTPYASQLAANINDIPSNARLQGPRPVTLICHLLP